MLATDINRLRLHHQQLSSTAFRQPQEVVSWLGAMQAQEYGNSKWGIGVRLPGLTAADIETAVSNRSIIRTWTLRGTLHLVAAADVRWMLDLVKPGVSARLRATIQREGPDDATFKKAVKLLIKAMEGGQQLTRKALISILTAKGISTAAQHMSHLLCHASLEGIICHGALDGKQFTYTLLDEWSPAPVPVSREAALALLARKYFTSHGPATISDFVWWSGLTIKEAGIALEGARKELVSHIAGEATYWMVPGSNPTAATDTALLLPAFDEYFIGYKDRSHCIDMQYISQVMTINGIFNPVMVLNGQITGTWKRTVKKDTVTIEMDPFKPLKKAQLKALEPAAAAYAAYSGLKLAGFR